MDVVAINSAAKEVHRAPNLSPNITAGSPIHIPKFPIEDKTSTVQRQIQLTDILFFKLCIIENMKINLNSLYIVLISVLICFKSY